MVEIYKGRLGEKSELLKEVQVLIEVWYGFAKKMHWS